MRKLLKIQKYVQKGKVLYCCNISFRVKLLKKFIYAYSYKIFIQLYALLTMIIMSTLVLDFENYF